MEAGMIIKFPPDDFADQQVTASSYSIHHSRLSAWLDYEDDSAIAGLDMITRAMTHIEAHLRSLYLLEAIPERFFDLQRCSCGCDPIAAVLEPAADV
jgi:hypothetical protein